MTRPGLRSNLRPASVHALAVTGLLVGLTACTQNSPSAAGDGSAAPGDLSVVATDDRCELSAVEAPSGTLTFSVANKGAKVTEFYVLASDKLRIVGEVENIGPGLTRDLVVKAAPGSYFTACKPGMTGDGIQAAFTVTDSGADLTTSGADADLVTQANAQYAAYVKDQTEQLVTNECGRLLWPRLSARMLAPPGW